MRLNKVIGICGKSGSGKSVYARKLSMEQNALLLDVDKIVHELLAVDRIKADVVGLLKNDSFIENGNINRKSLGAYCLATKI